MTRDKITLEYALELVDKLHSLPQEEVIDFIQQCQDPDTGGISACLNHDPHLLHTLSAVQILCTYNRLDAIDINGVVNYIVALQLSDGSFTGDKWGEVDTRFSFCAVATLALLNKLDAIDVDKAVSFVESCKNFDGGFGFIQQTFNYGYSAPNDDLIFSIKEDKDNNSKEKREKNRKEKED